MDIPEWNTLRVGTGDEVVLVVDFSAEASRLTAGFADLVPLLPDGYTVRAPQRTTWTEHPDGTPSVRLAAWLAGAEQVGPEVVAVLGYCAGCRLAAAYADRIAGPNRPAVVLVDPLPVLPQTLLHEYEEAVERLAPGLAPDVVTRAVTAAREHAASYTDLAELAGRLSHGYAALAVEGCRELGIDDEFADQLVARLAGYLRYLTIAAAAPASDTPPTLVLRSNEPLPAVLAREYPDAQQVAVSRAELLGHPTTAELVTRALAG